MCLAQLARGTSIMAVTDHLDTPDYDVNYSFEEFCRGDRIVKELNDKYGDQCLILSGVELGEGFWAPELCDKVMNLIDFDVVLGSIHVIKYKDVDTSFTRIDFSAFSEDDIYGFIDKYFDDVILMIEKVDINVVTHLTCPLRYIVWKYKIDVDMTRFTEKIKKIYAMMIERDIALEVNTLYYGVMGDAMPNKDLLRLYRSVGGKLITLGSDAHNTEAASGFFDVVINTLKEIGFAHICYYKKRKPYPIMI